MTLAQSLTALEKGNKIRLKRAALKRELFDLPLGDSRRKAAELVLRPPGWLEGMAVYSLLTACHHTGPANAKRWLQSVGVSHQRPVGDLTVREARALAEVVGQSVYTRYLRKREAA